MRWQLAQPDSEDVRAILFPDQSRQLYGRDFGVELVQSPTAARVKYGAASPELVHRPRITPISRQDEVRAAVQGGLGAEKGQEKREMFARRQKIREMQEMPREMALHATQFHLLFHTGFAILVVRFTGRLYTLEGALLRMRSAQRETRGGGGCLTEAKARAEMQWAWANKKCLYLPPSLSL